MRLLARPAPLRRLCSAAEATAEEGRLRGPRNPDKLQKYFHVPPTYDIMGHSYTTDGWSNLTHRVLGAVGQRLAQRPGHPLCLLKQRILHHFYQEYPGFVKGSRSPEFSLHEIADPVVTVGQNFDSLFVPLDHVSRTKTDSYYVNKDHVMRAHTSAHQHDLIKAGLDAFLLLGDVYRRDQVDRTHYPVFHQMEGVRLFSPAQLAGAFGNDGPLELFDAEHAERSPDRQEGHSRDTSILVGGSLRTTLEGLARSLFGEDAELRWVDAYFPFTHPSWELEVKIEDEWVEMLGCGIVEQKLLRNAGASEKVGWAFGLGLERWAMRLFGIPDIRLFWSQDPAFLKQFPPDADFHKDIVFEPIGAFPPRHNDVSFWLPPPPAAKVEPNDVAELVREVAGELAEDVQLIDSFHHPKRDLTSVCYRVLYRHPTKKLSQADVEVVHQALREALVREFGVEGRWD